jgi:large subunit ribosomal protein L10
MNREQKSAVIDEIAGQISNAEAVFAVDYRGISVPQAAELRAQLRDADASFRVVKNSLTERAADKAGAQALSGLLEGPTAFTFVRGDAAVAAKAINDFARRSGLMPFKGGLLDGRALTPEELQSIARLPARQVLHAQLVGTVAAPLTGLVRGLGGLLGGLAIALAQVHEKKESGEIEAGEPPARADEAPAEEAAPEEAAPEEAAPEEAAPEAAAPEEAVAPADASLSEEAADEDSTADDGGDAADDKE